MLELFLQSWQETRRMLESFGLDLSLPAMIAGVVFTVIGIVFWRRANRAGNRRQKQVAIALLFYSVFTPYAWLNWTVGSILTVIAFLLDAQRSKAS